MFDGIRYLLAHLTVPKRVFLPAVLGIVAPQVVRLLEGWGAPKWIGIVVLVPVVAVGWWAVASAIEIANKRKSRRTMDEESIPVVPMPQAVKVERRGETDVLTMPRHIGPERGKAIALSHTFRTGRVTVVRWEGDE